MTKISADEDCLNFLSLPALDFRSLKEGTTLSNALALCNQSPA